MANTVTMSANGRIVIPVFLREKYNLSRSSCLILEDDENGIHLLTPEQAIRRAQAIVSQYHIRDGVDSFLAERKADDTL